MKIKNILLVTCTTLLLPGYIFSQTGSVGIGTTTPNASAILDIQSAEKGMLIPRMTMVQRDAIINAANGLIIYQTDGRTGFYVNKAIPPFKRWQPVSGPQEAFMATRIASFQNIAPSSDFTLIAFDRINEPADINDGALFDPATHIFTAREAGLYFFQAGVVIQNASAGTYSLALDENLTSIPVRNFDQRTSGATSLLVLKVSDILWLTAGEHVMVSLKHNAASAQNVNNSVGTYFQGFRIY